jgi:hypothetical protein
MAGSTTIAEVARRYQLPYALLWRALTGGYRRPPPIPPDMEERLRAALAELEGKEVAGHAS